MSTELTWERIPDPIDPRKTVWWRGTWPRCGQAYASVAHRNGAYEWAVRYRPGPDHVATSGRAATLATARARAERVQADMSATVGGMAMTPHERAKAANAALTTEQRSAAGKARAATLHHPITLARRIGKAWAELSDDDKREVRRELRKAGVIA